MRGPDRRRRGRCSPPGARLRSFVHCLVSFARHDQRNDSAGVWRRWRRRAAEALPGAPHSFVDRHNHRYRAALDMRAIGDLRLGAAFPLRPRPLLSPRPTANDFGEYRLVASSPQASHPARHPRAKSSIRDGLLHASIISYISSGLRECSRFRVARKLTWRRPGCNVRAFLPRTPKRSSSVTFRK
jgi:hypothetical protein